MKIDMDRAKWRAIWPTGGLDLEVDPPYHLDFSTSEEETGGPIVSISNHTDTDLSRRVGQGPRNEGRAIGTRLPDVADDLICKTSFGGSRASRHVNIVPLLNDFE